MPCFAPLGLCAGPSVIALLFEDKEFRLLGFEIYGRYSASPGWFAISWLVAPLHRMPLAWSKLLDPAVKAALHKIRL